MPRRAVMVSFELWKQWITQGNKFESVECFKGIPDNAVLVDQFFKIAGAYALCDLVAVFDSPDFESVQDGEYLITAPSGAKYGTFTPEFRQHYMHENYDLVSWMDGGHSRKLSIRSTGPMSVLFGWQPEKAQGSRPLAPDPECKFDFEWLC